MMRKRKPSRKRKSGKATLSLDQLLIKQPKSLRRHPHYTMMIDHFLLSETLQKARMNRRCYNLLNKAVIDPENLGYFYKTYRLPQDPFFPLFFAIKRDYLQRREIAARQKEKYILNQMQSLAPDNRKIIRFLAEWEQGMNTKAERPLWEGHLYPRTKKRVRELLDFDETQWQQLFDRQLMELHKHYPRFSEPRLTAVKACLPLALVPEISPFRLPGTMEVQKAYLKKCRICHPDAGGNDARFTLIQQSRDILLNLHGK